MSDRVSSGQPCVRGTAPAHQSLSELPRPAVLREVGGRIGVRTSSCRAYVLAHWPSRLFASSDLDPQNQCYTGIGLARKNRGLEQPPPLALEWGFTPCPEDAIYFQGAGSAARTW